MKPFLVVHDLDEVLDVGKGLGEARVLVDVNLFDLEGVHEGLSHRVVVGVAPAAHADRDAVAGKDLHVFITRILRTTV